MTLSWGFIIPLGAVLPRTWKAALPGGLWYRRHRLVQLVGVLLHLVGVVLGLLMVPACCHLSGLHKVLGVTMAALALLQPLLAFARPAKPAAGESPSVQRQAWRLKHALLGYGLLALGAVQVVTGVRLSWRLEWLYALYGICIGLVVAFAAFGVWLGRRKRSPSGAAAGQTPKHVSAMAASDQQQAGFNKFAGGDL